MTTDSDKMLDQLFTIIDDLGVLRDQAADPADRDAINDHITALTKWWRKLDDARAAIPDDGLADSIVGLDGITADLGQEKEKLEDVAKVIHRAAQAVAIAEKLAEKAG